MSSLYTDTLHSAGISHRRPLILSHDNDAHVKELCVGPAGAAGPSCQVSSEAVVGVQFLSCDLVRGRGIVSRHYYIVSCHYYKNSIAKTAGKDFRDGAVVPFE